jgi:transposase
VGGSRVDRAQDWLCAVDPAGLGHEAEVDAGSRAGVTTSEAQRVKELEREVKELRRANEILKLASAFFAQAEIDRRLKS